MFAFGQSAPGGVTGGLNLWLKGDAGYSGAQWTDQTTFGFTFSQPTVGNQPSMGMINFNAAARFDGSNDYLNLSTSLSNLLNGSINNSRTQFIAINSTTSANAAVSDFYSSCGGSGDSDWNSHGNIWMDTGCDVSQPNYGTETPITANVSYLNAFSYENPSGDIVTYRNNVQTGTGSNPSLPSGFTLATVGYGEIGGYYAGDIGEFIVYDRILSNLERQRVDSYLAIRYGVTLGTTAAPINYLGADGTTIYWTGDTTYQNNIGGIGRDDATALNQKQSKSQNEGLQPVIGNVNIMDNNATNLNNFTTDKSYMVWGSDTGSTDFVTLFNFGDSHYRMERIWKVQETGSVGTVKVAIPMNSLYDVTNLKLVVSNDAIFNGTDTRIAMVQETFGGIDYYTATVNFTSGQFFTFSGMASAPGGVRMGLTSWNKQNVGNTNALWKNIINTNDATGGGNIIYNTATDLINFNGSYSFDTSGIFTLPSALDVSDHYSVFGVSKLKTAESNGRVFGSALSNVVIGYHNTHMNGVYYDGDPNSLSVGTNSVVPSTTEVKQYTYIRDDGPFSFYGNSTSILSGTTSGNTALRGTIGGSSGENSSVVVPEYITYNTTLNTTDQNKVESYLALKYGYTKLGGYISSSGNSFWNATTGYNNNVAGIGKDEASGLEQKVSKSVNAGAKLTLSTNMDFSSANDTASRVAINTDETFVMIGDDNTSVASTITTDLMTGFNTRIEREWRIQNTGFSQSINLKFIDLSVAGSDWHMVWDVDGNFTAGAIDLGTLNNNDEISVAGSQFNTGFFALMANEPDSDGDGVLDMNDLDDDNDGILDGQEGCGNVTNTEFSGTFGTTHIARDLQTNPGEGYTFSTSGDPAGVYAVISKSIQWHSSSSLWNYPGHTTGAIDDAYLAVNGSTAVGAFYRENLNLTNGNNYVYSFWHAAANNGNPYNLGLSIVRLSDGVEVAAANTGNQSNGTWQELSLNFTATSTEVYEARIINLSTASDGNDFAIDDISFNSDCQLDTDGDGILDHLDLDSDGDGCFDAIEGAENVTATQLNTNGSINITANGGINSDGVPNLVNAGGAADTGGDVGQRIGSSRNAAIESCLDTDGDGIPNYVDSDDDNDGILDIDECSTPVGNATFSTSNNSPYSFTAPEADLGFVFDVYTLDNSFNLTVNGVPLANQEIQFTSEVGLVENIRFVDGSMYGSNGVPEVWEIIGSETTSPSVRIIINVDGSIAMYGSKVSGGPLYPLELYGGAGFNSILWNSTTNNIVSISQEVSGPTYITGKGSGYKKGFCDIDSDGVSNELDLDSDGDGCFDALEGYGDIKPSQLNPNGSINVIANGGINSHGVPNLVSSAGGANVEGDIGQGIGTSQNPAVNTCFDTDGDGILDSVDLDDDNDGILDGQEGCGNVTRAEFNGTFGTTLVARDLQTDPGGGYIFSTSGAPASVYAVISKSIQWHPLDAGLWNYPGHTTGATDDAYLGVNGSTTVGTFYKESVNLTSGSTYVYSFWHAAARDGDPYNLELSIVRLSDGVQVASANTGSQSSGTWQELTMNFTATSTEVYEARIINLSTTINQNDFAIDDISFLSDCQLDTDGDGILDHLDLDSDGDGCPDAIEGDENVIGNQINPNGSINILLHGGINSDGVPNLVNAGGVADIGGTVGQGIGSSRDATVENCVDTDGDGLLNYEDLDDDNDGILDQDEICITSSTANFNPLTEAWQDTNLTINQGQSYRIQLTNSSIGLLTAVGGPNDGKQFYAIAHDTNLVSDYDGYRYSLSGGSANYLVASEPNVDIPFANLVSTDYNSLLTFIGMIDTNNDGQYTPSAGDKLVPVLFSMSEGIDGGVTFIAPGSGKLYVVYTDDDYPDNSGVMDFVVQTCSIKDTDGDGIPNYLDLDSDGDGCPDAIEGDENVISSQLNTNGSIKITTNGGINAGGVPNLVNAGGAADIGGDVGQGVGSSQDAAIQPSGCGSCYKPAITAGNTLDTVFGITALGRAGANGDNWPMVRKGAWTVLEAKTKGLVLNRVPFDSSGNPIGILPSNFVEGMIVYDTTNHGIKIYTTTDSGSTYGWYQFDTQTCP
ncbi:hypothetical protein D1631_06200 [Chryseobacterium nematophagum]|uniref:DUF8202 domain-containing protein n=1 Tax=Chryseobacterium nematophagum TaxID=2305228 RepID=A0A3M7TH48_9FLAO|nr:hypothetical protein D1631_06200 [Chryseobacterium nematophagum]